MKKATWRKWTIMTAVALLLSTTTAPATWARSRHWHGHGPGRFGVGVVIGAPFFWPGYYPPPYYYRPVVVAPASPPVYIEQGSLLSDAPSQQHNYWYYCVDAKGYYPYVRQCPGGWLQVVPQAPANQ